MDDQHKPEWIKVDEWDFVEYVDSLLRSQEAVDLEFKTARAGFPNSVWETYSSFANTDGGTIVLGIKEKNGALFVEGLLPEQIVSYRQIICNQLNNPDCVNVNLLTDKNIQEVDYRGKSLLLIYVPRASRSQRPVYLTRNPLNGHTYKRNNEGDYKCTDTEVRRMIADADEEHPRDSRILCNYSMEDIDLDSLKQYRLLLSSRQPDHPWLTLDDMAFLRKLGGYRQDRQTGQEGFTLAGILMFGRTESITDNECAPSYFPDYQEKMSVDENVRWTDRICMDGTWEANLFQFYRRVYPKLSSVLPKPFRLENGVRLEDTTTHVALREAFVNTLVHCDYMEEGNITIEQWKDRYVFKNPGTLLVSKAQYYAGGESICRNKSLQKMFMLIGFSEKAGSGVNKIFMGWKNANWRPPFVEEQSHPDRVVLNLPMESLYPEEVLEELKRLFGREIERIPYDQFTVLALCYSENQVSNERLQYILNQHSSNITKLLKSMCNAGFLESIGNGRGTRYRLLFLEKDESKPQKDESKLKKDESKSQKDESKLEKDESKKYMRYEDLSRLILSVCEDYVALEIIAEAVHREASYLINRVIPRMLEDGLLERLYPSSPKHPLQKYRVRQVGNL